MSIETRERKYIYTLLLVFVIATQILMSYGTRSAIDLNQLNTMYWIRHVFCFGMPSLIVFWQVFEIRAYPEDLPKNYLWERLRYIFIPYLIFGGFYSFYLTQTADTSFWPTFQEVVLLGNWHGYFVLVLFQFTALNLLVKWLKKDFFKSFIPVAVLFAVSTMYLHFNELGLLEAIQHPALNYEIHILGWLYFYALGSFIGHHYDTVKELLTDYLPVVILGAILSFGYFILLNWNNNLEIHPMNASLLLYHSFMMLIILQSAVSLVGVKEDLVDLIEPYLLFSLLLTPIVNNYLYSFYGLAEEQSILLLSTGLIFILGFSIGVGVIMNQFSLTRMMLGRLTPMTEEKEHSKQPAVVEN